MSARGFPLVTLSALVLALAGCQARESAPPASSSSGTQSAGAGQNVLRVTTSDFAFDAPDQVPAGLTTIRLINKGPSLHHVELVKLDQGKTVNDFLAALKAGGPPPSWVTMIGGPNPPEFGDSSTAIIALAPGSYAMVCFIPAADGVPHVMKGMAHAITVTGTANATAEPEADATVKLVDYDFQFAQPLTAGHHTIRIENAGQQVHELVFVRLQPGKTAQDFAGWAEKMTGPPPGAVHGGVSGIMPGAHAFVVTDLPAAEYAVICFFPDAKDGKPHLAHGMMKTIKVG